MVTNVLEFLFHAWRLKALCGATSCRRIWNDSVIIIIWISLHDCSLFHVFVSIFYAAALKTILRDEDWWICVMNTYAWWRLNTGVKPVRLLLQLVKWCSVPSATSCPPWWPAEALENNTMKTDIGIILLRYMTAILWRDYDLHLRLRWSFETVLIHSYDCLRGEL